MEKDTTAISNIVETSGDLVETYRKLITMRVVEYTSLGVSLGILGILMLLLIMLALLFIGLGLAWWIGNALHNMKAGFFIVGGVYTILLIGVLAIATRYLLPYLRNLIIKKIYEQD